MTSGQEQFAAVGGGITLCYRTDGDPADPALMLIAGLAQHYTAWPEEMVHTLVEHGFHVVRVDNRDVGRSTAVANKPPGALRILLGRPRANAYDLGDMARDCIGLLDHIDVPAAHLVGMSMGAMIAQTIAARYPTRARSLTSIFSTTGDRRVGQPAKSTMLRLVAPPARTRQRSVDAHVSLMRHVGSQVYALDEVAERRYAAHAWDRGRGATAWKGNARQISAIQKSGDRTAELRLVSAPTLVVHGDRDLMIHPSGGDATAAVIPGARRVVISGMGHHLPAPVVSHLTALIADHATQGVSQ